MTTDLSETLWRGAVEALDAWWRSLLVAGPPVTKRAYVWSQDVRPGDWVFTASTVDPEAWASRVGRYEGTEDESTRDGAVLIGWWTLIECPDGTPKRWTNASFIRVPFDDFSAASLRVAQRGEDWRAWEQDDEAQAAFRERQRQLTGRSNIDA